MNKNQPLISVLIPTKNRKRLLFNALKSVISQSYTNLQIIISDNHSNDGTLEYIKELLQDIRVEYYCSDIDLSMTENWNRAFLHARGEYIIRLDDDNIFLNTFLEDALFDIVKNKLDCLIYLPLILHQNNKIFFLFDPNESIYILNKYQLTYLEYMALTDSNYIIYRNSALKKVIKSEAPYKTTLPDRFMNYSLASSINVFSLRIAICTKIAGITRFDYKGHPGNAAVKLFINYENPRNLAEFNKYNCHYNFSAHRIITILTFFMEIGDKELESFFYKNITNRNNLSVVMKVCHISSLMSSNSEMKFISILVYVFSILFSIVCRPFTMFEGKRLYYLSLQLILSFIKKLHLLMRLSSQNILNITSSYNDFIISEIVNNGLYAATEKYGIMSVHGNISEHLEKYR